MHLTGSDDKAEDLYALYWLKRNEIVFNEHLNKNDRVIFLDYAVLVSDSKHCVDIIIKRSGGEGVWPYFYSDANTSSLSRTVNPKISSEISVLCNKMYTKLVHLAIKDFPATID